MPLRTPPKSLSDKLQSIQPGLRIEWDEAFSGWRFVLNGFRNPALLHHADGVLVEELSLDETVTLWYQGRVTHPEWLRQQREQQERRKEYNQREKDKAKAQVEEETAKVLEHKFNPRAYSLAHS